VHWRGGEKGGKSQPDPLREILSKHHPLEAKKERKERIAILLCKMGVLGRPTSQEMVAWGSPYEHWVSQLNGNGEGDSEHS
jgi:hypothetical protein